MAKRLVFLVDDNNGVEEVYIDFEYIKGMAFSQRVKCADSLGESIKKKFPNLKHLEVSTKSRNELGKALSAFNLKDGDRSVESIFQSSKVFEDNVQFDFLIDYPPLEAKKHVRENHEGPLIKFRYQNIDYPLEPPSAFYDWVYIHALRKSAFSKQVINYDVFSDIEFNDVKSINCQARAVAIYVSLFRQKKIDYYLSSFGNFKELYTSNFVNKGIIELI